MADKKISLKNAKYFSVIFLLAAIAIVYYHEKIFQLNGDYNQITDRFLEASKISQFSVEFLIINLTIVFAAWTLEIVFLGWNKSSLKRILAFKDASTKGDVYCWVLTVLSLYDFFVLIFSFGFFYVLCSIIVRNFNIGWGIHLNNEVAQFLILFILNDFKHFLWHWNMHKVRAFWELHQYHHSAKYFNMITTSRGHFLEKGIHTVFDAFVFILFGAPPELFYYIIVVREAYQLILHSDLNWHFGWLGRYVLISPAAHKLHHSVSTKDFNKNYGTFLIFWDRVFGTYANPNRPIQIGLPEDPFNKNSFWKDMVTGSKNFITQVETSFRIKKP